MSESAFGVDHGEISKAFGAGAIAGGAHKLAKPGAGLLKPMQSAGAGLKTGFKAAGADFTPMKSLQGSKSFMGGARVGNFAQANKKPLAIGGGIAAGGSAFAAGRRGQ